ncbi:XdhC family protein [Sinimarinibacterium flocculans]|uniref:Xanthine dehydrogenase accessory factor n=1 Tax=Sinimarinibacterium flocculans TaxID=985250 RepID=A0A318ED78_9GAMM|nr:XdhC family protein [Sinimarinibacterium flocculans]PXV65711.1 xanthine dehydrogenase accessory factor [Sinimarinibacterium flocculans]
MNETMLRLLTEFNAQRRAYAVATVVETVGSVSAKTSAKAVIDDEGRVVFGWVGGGCAESAACSAALQCIESGEPTVLEIDLDDEVLGAGMPCGGHMRVFVDPVNPKPRLWLLGHGRVAEVLCAFGDTIGLEVIVNDPGATAQQYPAAQRIITDDLDYEQLDPIADDYVVIATQHKGDHESMQRVLASQARYIALIASRKRARLVLQYLRDLGVGEAALARVMAPAGLDLGARTPEEIALSVIAQIVMTRRGGSGKLKKTEPEAPSAKRKAAETA